MATAPISSTITPEGLPINFRDIATINNKLSSTIQLHPHRLYRTSFLPTPPPPSLPPIKTNIDLRTPTERHRTASSSTTSTTSSDPKISTPPSPWTPLPISVLSRRYELHLLSLLSWWSLLLVLWYLITMRRVKASRIVGSQALGPLGLLGMSLRSLEYSQKEICGVLRELANETRYPIAVSCTAGKDRTGVTIILLQLLCGIEEEVIVAEYCASDREMGRPEAGWVREEMCSVGGLGKEMLGAPEEVVRGVVERVNGWEWGGMKGIRAWCEEGGLGWGERERLRGLLVVGYQEGSLEGVGEMEGKKEL